MSETLAQRTVAAMERLGWRYDPETTGFTWTDHWVSFEQAQGALDAAEKGEVYEPEPVSREFAAVVATAVAHEL